MSPGTCATSPLRARRTDERRLLPRDVVLLLLASAPLFVGLAAGVQGSEARWLFVSQEMLRTGNWLEPRILGEFYGDKPLLSYWLITLLATPFGVVDETVARLPSAISAAGVVLLTAWCAALYASRRVAVFAGLIVATSFSLIFWARIASADLDSLLFSTAAVVVYAAARQNARGWHAPLFFALLALAGHAKGMPGVAVPLAVAVADASISGRLRAFAAQGRSLVIGAALGAVLYLAPFAASRAVHGDWELLRLMWSENFVRAFAAFDHTANPFYYVYTLPAMLLPWGLWLPGALLSASIRRDRSEGERFAAVAFAVTFALFTLSQSRRSYYILPIFPWAAILIAAWWEGLAAASERRGDATRSERVLALVPAAALAVALCAVGAALAVGRILPGDLRALATALPWSTAIAAPAFAIGAVLLCALWRGDLRVAHTAVAAAGLLGSAVYATSLGAALERDRVEHSFAAQVKARFPGRSIVYYGGTGLDIQWYLGPGTSAAVPEQVVQLLDAAGSEDLLVVCGRKSAACLDGARGLRTERLIERWTPAVSRFVPAKHRYTLVRVQRG